MVPKSSENNVCETLSAMFFDRLSFIMEEKND